MESISLIEGVAGQSGITLACFLPRQVRLPPGQPWQPCFNLRGCPRFVREQGAKQCERGQLHLRAAIDIEPF